MLKIIPLGGFGEIGLNMMVVENGDELLIIDAGLMFPEDEMIGVDFVIPNIEYIRQKRFNVTGIILTHAHEDHIGALPYLLREINIPVFGTPFTLGVVRHKLEEHNLFKRTTLNVIKPGVPIKIGKFELDTIRVSHSVVDGIGIAIHTPMGFIIHTGDFKIDYSPVDGMATDLSKFSQYGEQGVLALLSDSTNVENEGYSKSDKELSETLEKIWDDSRGRIIVALFASSINRIQQFVNIAKRKKNKLIFNGRSIEASVSIAKELGLLNIPGGMEIDLEQMHKYPDDQILIITTGSQGEPMSALARMSSGFHKHIKIKKGDTIVLSSKFIPGNEKAIAKNINNLYRRGADVIYEKISEVHTSGHAFQDELKLMIHLTKPQYFIPIHGEYRHLLLHARLAELVGISKDHILLAENGDVIEFDKNGARIQGKIKTTRVLIDGKGIGDVGKSILKERHALSEDGVVAVTLAFDEETGIIIYGPEIVSKGFVFETETGHLLQDAICVILEIVEDIKLEDPCRLDIITSRIQSDLTKYFQFTIGRKPVILPFIMKL